MKKMACYFATVLSLFAALTGCGNAEVPEEPQEENVLVELTVSDLDEIFSSMDISQASLSCSFQNEETQYLAHNAIRAEQYLKTLQDFTWESYQVPADWEWNDLSYFQLTAPGVTLTAYQSGPSNTRLFRVVTDRGEGTFVLPELTNPENNELIQISWMAPETLSKWYEEAMIASIFSGNGTPLTAEELSWFETYTASEQNRYNEAYGGYYSDATPISCFFTSFYEDPRDLNGGEFLAYCPSPEGPEVDEEEFSMVQTKLDWRSGKDDHLFTLEEMPVPCHRLPRAHIDEILTTYAGITTADMHTDWLEEALYIPETDSFYTFTSDFGPGVFIPRYGERNGDLVTLWSISDMEECYNVLKIQKQGDNSWRILSHQRADIP